LVVVDTGSTDRTAQIAADHGAKVHAVPWDDDFAAARNVSFDLCTGDWIVWLDADDVIPPESQDAFRAVKDDLTDAADAVVAPYHYRTAGDARRVIRFHRERLIRRGAGLRWSGRAYEHISAPPGRSVLRPELVIEHRPDAERQARHADRNIAILSRAVQEGDRSPRTLFYYANELYDHQRFLEAAQHYQEYLAADPEGADRYWAHLYLAEAFRALGNEPAARDAAVHAIGEDASRAEAYMTLGRIHFDAEEWDEALPLFLAATAGSRPGYGLARDTDYGCPSWDYLSVCYEKLGRLDEALAAAQRALPGNPEADRVRANMRWIVDHL
jgi:glycosyltransferase involved in cell wall biosynthesis